jgi:hypothetical protein
MKEILQITSKLIGTPCLTRGFRGCCAPYHFYTVRRERLCGPEQFTRYSELFGKLSHQKEKHSIPVDTWSLNSLKILMTTAKK